MNAPTQVSPWSAKRFLKWGFGTLAVLVIGLGLWATLTSISGAVVATGTLEVASSRQVVEHSEGGVVQRILVQDGDVVDAGEVLIKLDGTLMQSEYDIVEGQLFELLARHDRLIAERDEADNISFGKELIARAESDLSVQTVLAGQVGLFVARQTAQREELAQLNEQKKQVFEQIVGIEAQLVAVERQHAVVINELGNQENLLGNGLTQLSQVSALQRDEAALSGSLGELVSSIAQARGQISQIEIEILRLNSSLREEAITTLLDLQFQEVELRERRLSLRERLSRLDIRAPRSGIIYGLQVRTLRSVISPAEPILYVVPQDTYLIVTTRIAAQDIDQVEIGQAANLRFSAFDARTTPEIKGSVTNLSADIFTDETTGMSFYIAEMLPNDGEMQKLHGRELLPGMPVEVFIKTGDRSPLQYLLKPLAGYFYRAFREE